MVAQKYRIISLLPFIAMLLITSASMFAATNAGANPAIGATTRFISWTSSPVDAPIAVESEPPMSPEIEAPVTPEDEPPTTPETEPPVTPEDEPPTTPETEPPVTPEDEPPTTPETEPPTTPAASPVGAISSSSSYYKLWEDWTLSDGTSKGWYDAEKAFWNFQDDNMCWAASASNMLAWTGWGQTSGMETCDEIFAHFYDHWTDDAGHQYYGTNWWFDGTVSSSSPSQVDVAGGGNFHNQLTFSDYCSYSTDNKTLLQQIDSRLQQGYAIGLGITKEGKAVGHAITCWGVDYNTSYDPSNPTYNKYIAIWVTDSDDNKGDDFALPWLGNAGIQNRLRRYTVGYNVNKEKWFFTGPGWFDYGGLADPGWYIDDITWLAAGPGIVPKVAAGSDQTVDEAVTVSFAGAYSSPGPAPTIKWDFGDGSTSSGSLTPSHAYSNDGVYTVTLTITDPQGDWATDTLIVTVEKVVPIAYAGSDQTVDEGDTVSFSGSYSYTGAGTLTIEWDFGDGSTATGSLTPQHQYVDDGIYVVTLTLTDHNGDVGTDTLIVTVKNVAPTLTLGGAASSDEGAIYTLTLQATDPGDDTITAWGIDWGDGFSEIILGNPTAVNHTYADGPNSWTIQANATDEDGTWAAVNTLAVAVLNVAPAVCIVSVNQAQSFTLAEWIVVMRDPLVATGNASDPGSDDLTFNWSWGDGLENVTFYLNDPPTYPVAIVEILEHTYMEPGEYLLTLTVTDDDGGVGAVIVTITVWGPRDLKNNVIAELEALKTDEKCIDRRLERVIRCVESSLYQQLWLDETHLDAYWGWCVFLWEHLAEVHLELRSELYEHFIPMLEEWIAAWQAKGCDTTWLEAKLARMQAWLPVFETALFELAKADELLARVAIADVENTPVQNAKWQHKVDCFLLKANQHLANASTYLEMERFGTAICHYKIAWMFAQKAMRWAIKSGFHGGWGWGCGCGCGCGRGG